MKNMTTIALAILVSAGLAACNKYKNPKQEGPLPASNPAMAPSVAPSTPVAQIRLPAPPPAAMRQVAVQPVSVSGVHTSCLHPTLRGAASTGCNGRWLGTRDPSTKKCNWVCLPKVQSSSAGTIAVSQGNAGNNARFAHLPGQPGQTITIPSGWLAYKKRFLACKNAAEKEMKLAACTNEGTCYNPCYIKPKKLGPICYQGHRRVGLPDLLGDQLTTGKMHFDLDSLQTNPVKHFAELHAVAKSKFRTIFCRAAVAAVAPPVVRYVRHRRSSRSTRRHGASSGNGCGSSCRAAIAAAKREAALARREARAAKRTAEQALQLGRTNGTAIKKNSKAIAALKAADARLEAANARLAGLIRQGNSGD